MEDVATLKINRVQDELPFSLPLELNVQDRETVAELCALPDGESRDKFALQALRIGVLALKQARGRLDADLVRRESDRLLESLNGELKAHAGLVRERLEQSLREYFDPESGRFHDRVDRLVRKDGELENALRRQIGGEDSELVKTLGAHFGSDSPLMRLLSPDQSRGLLAQLRETVDDQLRDQRERVLREFSLDDDRSALRRFIGELEKRHGELSTGLRDKIDEVVREFSLDEEDGALSRLVGRVTTAQETITKEFSLDNRESALSRLQRELNDRLEREREANRKFQEEVRVALGEMVVRKRETEKAPRHGIDFEDVVFGFVQHEAQTAGDVATATGATTGVIRNCKVGDVVLELGPENAAAGARIVFEVKEKAGYNLATAREEIDTARKNREAQVGLFVFSKRTAPDGLEPLTRIGEDVFVVWDAEDGESDVYLKAGITLARALCVRSRGVKEGIKIEFGEIDKAVLEIEKRANSLDDVETWANTIKKSSEKILDKVDKTRRSLHKQVGELREHLDDVKHVLNDETEAGA